MHVLACFIVMTLKSPTPLLIPACYEDDYPVVFATEREAQREIADHQLIRIRQFLDGERDFDNAITTDEFILPVVVWPDRRISTEVGRVYGNQE